MPHIDLPAGAIALVVLAALGLGLGACGSGGSDAATTVPAPVTEPAANECRVGLPSLVSVLTSGLKPAAKGNLARVNAVRTDLLPHTYYLSAEVPEVSGERALWVSTADDGTGPVYSVNAAALQSSTWSDATKATAGYSATDPAAVAALACP